MKAQSGKMCAHPGREEAFSTVKENIIIVFSVLLKINTIIIDLLKLLTINKITIILQKLLKK